jgi:hypothetical protein
MSKGQLKDSFDQMLKCALQKHAEAVPADFTNNVLRQIRQAQQQKILARVILQERLALAACIMFGGITITIAAVFPDTVVAVFRGIAINLTEQGEALIDKVPQAIKAVSGQWQFYTIITGSLAIAIFSIVELFAGDSSWRSA